MFVHVGVIHLIAEIAGLVQVGLLVERLVGRLAFAAVYVASGVLAGVWSMTLLLCRFRLVPPERSSAFTVCCWRHWCSAWLRRASLTVPVRVLKGLGPG